MPFWIVANTAPLLSTIVTGVATEVERSGVFFRKTSKIPLDLRFSKNHFFGKRGKPGSLLTNVFEVL